MEFSQLKQEYKFLGDILKLYNKLDETVVENDENKEILKLCDNAATFDTNLRDVEKIVCKKLLNNLLQLKNDKYDDDFKKRCNNLYVWLYFEIKKSGISNDIIKQIFDLSELKEKGMIRYFLCPYYTFIDQKHEPEDLMKLSIFNNNADAFQSLLMDSEKSKDCHLKKYVYECVDIYKKMNKNYSSSGDCNTSQHKNACEIIKFFNRLYMSYIFKKEGISDEFPELSSDTPLDLNNMCPLDEIEPDTPSEERQQDTPKTGGVPTALSAMVGIPPFLALIYKFTPVGKFFRFRNRNNMIIASNFDKNMENEIFHAIKEDSNIKDIHPKYNIGYEPI
ncbi:PIR protein [Plasmodium vivax]|uniref:VIR protein n=1 Tax=Plasmodium vivax TaxID=5855 RepID=A0A565A3R0_PLAVI|nr:PIR protein [Plasmodium vivax]